MHPFLFRPATCLVCLCLWCVLAGCKPAVPPAALEQSPADARRQPSTVELANYVRAGLPPVIKLVELKNDPPVPLPGSAPGSSAWLYNVRFIFAPAEDELGPPTPQDAQSFQALLDELNELAAWSQAYAKSPYASLYPGFTVEVLTPTTPQLLRVLHPKDRPRAPIYGKLAAEWQVDHWQFSVEDATLPKDDGGKFRSEFSGPILIQGDAATDHYVAAAKAAVAQARPKKAAIERRYQEDLAKATQPGTTYKGSITHGSSTMPAEVRFVAPPESSPGFARFEMRLPATGYVYTASARLATQMPNLPAAPANASAHEATGGSETIPQVDMTISYEDIHIPKPVPINEFATDFMYHARDTRDGFLNVRDHQLKGQVGTFAFGPGFVLTAQQQAP